MFHFVTLTGKHLTWSVNQNIKTPCTSIHIALSPKISRLPGRRNNSFCHWSIAESSLPTLRRQQSGWISWPRRKKRRNRRHRHRVPYLNDDEVTSPVLLSGGRYNKVVYHSRPWTCPPIARATDRILFESVIISLLISHLRTAGQHRGVSRGSNEEQFVPRRERIFRKVLIAQLAFILKIYCFANLMTWIEGLVTMADY